MKRRHEPERLCKALLFRITDLGQKKIASDEQRLCQLMICRWLLSFIEDYI
jgi:hypothetical protein